MTQKEFLALLKKVNAGLATPQEENLIKEWLDRVGADNAGLRLPTQEEQLLEDRLRQFAHKHAQTSQNIGKHTVMLPWRLMAAAASLLLLMASSYYLVWRSSSAEQILYTQTTMPAAEEMIIISSSDKQRVTLADGSTVTLEPNSTLRYARHFGAGDKRETFLEGEGFFNVKPDAQKPFFVVAGDVVTKVVGTSFSVKAGRSAQETVVAVSTGCVKVGTRQHGLFTQKDTYQEGATLTPNQQAVFNRQEKALVAGLVEKPAIMATAENQGGMEFSNVPLEDIFNELEKAYGVDIVFDPTAISTCFVTTKLYHESLFDRLGIVCKVSNCRYHVQGIQIIIESTGCH